MDGTLTVPNLDFKAMYANCGVAMSEDLLAAIATMPAADAARARGVVEAAEAEGRASLQLAGGVVELAAWLQRHGVKTALVTRNSGATVDALLSRLWAPAGLPPFDVTVSRDSPVGLATKPDPAALQFIADRWGLALPCGGLLMVGDSPANDVAFGAAAGVATALVDSGRRYLEEAAAGVDVATAVAKGGSHAGSHGLGGVNAGRGVGGGADLCVASLALLPRLLWQRFTIGGPLGTAMPLLKYDTPLPSTPAAEAAARGDAAALASLSAAELCARDASGNSPLVWAAEGGHVGCVQALLATPGVEVDAAGFLGATALNRASRR
jgi:phosphoglycolate phosphatase-like HAD superfamily hydrolase